MNAKNADWIVLVVVFTVLSGFWLVSNLTYHSQPHLSEACQRHMDCTAEDRALLEENGGGVIPGKAIWVKGRETIPNPLEVISYMKPLLDCLIAPLGIFFGISLALSMLKYLVKP
jgi:hypothetical protein